MTDLTPDEQRIADAFASEHAPQTMGEWRTRVPGRAVSGRRSLRPVLALISVALIAGGLGSYFGIRGHVGAGGAAGSGAYPAARSEASLAFDQVEGVVVMFGGYNANGKPLNDTWTWDGSAWTEQHPAHAPPARAGAAMAYDSPSRSVLLFGGVTQPLGGVVTQCAGPPGIVAPSSGRSVAPSGTASPPPIPPSPSALPASGGSGEPPAHLLGACVPAPPATDGDTWSWNGSDWQRVTTGKPTVEDLHLMATDPKTGRPLLVEWGAGVGVKCTALYSPDCGIGALAWTWSGSAWVAVAKPPSIGGSPGLDPIGLAVDPATGRLALVTWTPPIAVCASTGAAGGAPAAVPPVGAAPQPCAPPDTTSQRPLTQLLDWTGSAWSAPETVTGASNPYLPGGVAYDGARNDLVIVGFAGPVWTGYTSVGKASTWTWNGTAWAQHPGASPEVVDGAASAFDASSGQLVLFGGLGLKSATSGASNLPVSNETWTWDGSVWTLRGGQRQPRQSIPTPMPVPLPAQGVEGGGSASSSQGGNGCSTSWSATRDAAGAVDLTFTAGGPNATCAATFSIVDVAGHAADVSNGTLMVSPGATKHVVWANWCGTQPLSLMIDVSGAGGGMSPLTAPSCSDKSKPSTWTLASASPS